MDKPAPRLHLLRQQQFYVSSPWPTKQERRSITRSEVLCQANHKHHLLYRVLSVQITTF